MALKAQPTFSLKDDLFNAETVHILAASVKRAWPEFDDRAFKKAALAGFKSRELKARIEWMVELLAQQLPSDVAAALDILERALPPPLDPTKTDDDFGRFIWAVPAEYAAQFGCTKPHLKRALVFLEQCTQRFSVENAIRPFLNTFPTETMRFIKRCSKHRNYHVRRLASEGTRPLLPWSPRVNLRTDDVLPVLSTLHTDATRYVTRSVANHLNDISKSDPAQVLSTLEDWNQLGKQDKTELEWMTRHALRTLRKHSHAPALTMLGYRLKPVVTFHPGLVSDTVRPGANFEWQCALESGAKQVLAIQLRIHFLKANGAHKITVFKVKDAAFKKGERLEITKRQLFRPMTTRTLYPGVHYADLEVNGVIVASTEFELLAH